MLNFRNRSRLNWFVEKSVIVMALTCVDHKLSMGIFDSEIYMYCTWHMFMCLEWFRWRENGIMDKLAEKRLKNRMRVVDSGMIFANQLELCRVRKLSWRIYLDKYQILLQLGFSYLDKVNTKKYLEIDEKSKITRRCEHFEERSSLIEN